jgi:hypothetical protein
MREQSRLNHTICVTAVCDMQVGFIASLHGERSHRFMSEVLITSVSVVRVTMGVARWFRACLVLLGSKFFPQPNTMQTAHANDSYAYRLYKLSDAWSIEVRAQLTTIQVTAPE